MEIDKDKFERIKKGAEEFYKSLNDIYCPYFKEKVNFNIRGLDHIKFKSWNKARSQHDQYIRLRLLPLAPKILRASGTLQGLSKTKEFVRKKINKRWENILSEVTYYEFIAVIKDVRVKVIVKQIEGGQKFFWSIIPFWRMNKDKSKRLLHTGKPAED